jgi:hypothetical protein
MSYKDTTLVQGNYHHSVYEEEYDPLMMTSRSFEPYVPTKYYDFGDSPDHVPGTWKLPDPPKSTIKKVENKQSTLVSRKGLFDVIDSEPTEIDEYVDDQLSPE